jgi:hypothetical protein
MGISRGPKIVSSGLVLCLDAANKLSYPGTGTTWTDLSGNGNNGTLTNGPTFSAGNQGSIVFDGADDYVNIPYNSGLIPNNLTLSAWINRTDVVNYAHFIGIPASNTTWLPPYVSYGIEYIGGSNTISFATGYTDNNYDNTNVTAFGNNVWFNFTATYDKTNVKIYINGLLQITRAETRTLFASTANFYIGSNNTTNGYPLNGKIANTLLYNRSLSATEVLQNYNATKGRFGR